MLCESLCICDVVRIFHDSLVKPYHFGVQMKKFVLASAVISTLVVTGCSSNKPESNYSTAKPIVSTGTSTNKPNTTVSKPNTSVTTPTVVAHKNSMEISTIKKSLDEDLKKGDPNAEVTSYSIQVTNADNQKDKITLNPLGQGFGIHDWSDSISAKNGRQTVTVHSTGKMYLFQQDYSAVGWTEATHETVNGVTETLSPEDRNKSFTDFIIGQATTNLPTKGTYNYAGDVKIRVTPKNTNTERYTDSRFNYAVNFENRRGKGQISNVDGQNIQLAESNIKNLDKEDWTIIHNVTGNLQGIEGVAQVGNKTGEYRLGFFGPNANEVTGDVSIEDVSFDKDYYGIIGGKKQ